MTGYLMEAKENYDPTHVSYIAGLSSYHNTFLCAQNNHQGIQWDAVRRNLMYMYAENTPSSPTTNTSGHTLWDGATAYAPLASLPANKHWNSSVGVKNIDTGTVNFYSNYNSANVVPSGIGGSDGTYRRCTLDFHANTPSDGGNGPGMTDPHTGNFWVASESCELYCFRLADNYSQIISPLFPVKGANNGVIPVGFTTQGATGPWTFAREVDGYAAGAGQPVPAYLYLVPKDITATETSHDYLLTYATFTYPMQEAQSLFSIYNREVFDHSGNMYVFSCSSSGGKNFKLYKFTLPTSAPYGGPTVGGGFTDITPWGSGTGPNADGTDYTVERSDSPFIDPGTADLIPMYLPGTDDLVLIEKFLPNEKTSGGTDPADLFWSCTYVHGPSGTPTFDHHPSFVTGYVDTNFKPTTIGSAAYAVIDAFEINTYLGQSDYDYTSDVTGLDYTKRWFAFVCTKMTNGDSDNKPRIVFVEYQFVYGSAPVVTRLIDEQGWDDAYPGKTHTSDVFAPYAAETYNAVAAAMDASGFNQGWSNARWDSGVYDPETNSFWFSGCATDQNGQTAFFSQFDPAFADRMQTDTGSVGSPNIGATPPFLRLGFDYTPPPTPDFIHSWGFSLDGHDFYVLRVGDSSLIFDLTTGAWSEWASPGRTNWRPHVGQNWKGLTAIDTSNGETEIVCGDDATGTLWRLNVTKGRDDRSDIGNDPFTRIVTGGVQVIGRETVQCGAVELDLALGNPTQTGAYIQLEISNDLGQTWVDCGINTIVANDYSAVVEWRGLGSINQPGRLFRLTDDGATVRIGGLNLR